MGTGVRAGVLDGMSTSAKTKVLAGAAVGARETVGVGTGVLLSFVGALPALPQVQNPAT